ncbi:MAG: glycosyltransferase family 2 protein [Verrucomicrobiae bacterium]
MGKPLVILPSYNSGEQLLRTMASARQYCDTVWVVVDGSTDGSGQRAREVAGEGFRVILLEKNSGKGGAVLRAFREAAADGFSHALVMDADGQHSAEAIPEFFQKSQRWPEALIAGVPVFGPEAPSERVKGRRIGNAFALIETWGMGAADALFGFRIYPIAPALRVLESRRGGRRFDFDTVMAVRLLWAGVPTINVPVPVRYPARSEGGVTHFRYFRDNLLLTRVHVRLCFEMLPRIPALISMRCRR